MRVYIHARHSATLEVHTKYLNFLRYEFLSKKLPSVVNFLFDMHGSDRGNLASAHRYGGAYDAILSSTMNKHRCDVTSMLEVGIGSVSKTSPSTMLRPEMHTGLFKTGLHHRKGEHIDLGPSLQVWADFFPNARIILGADFDGDVVWRVNGAHRKRIKTFQKEYFSRGSEWSRFGNARSDGYGRSGLSMDKSHEKNTKDVSENQIVSPIATADSSEVFGLNFYEEEATNRQSSDTMNDLREIFDLHAEMRSDLGIHYGDPREKHGVRANIAKDIVGDDRESILAQVIAFEELLYLAPEELEDLHRFLRKSLPAKVFCYLLSFTKSVLRATPLCYYEKRYRGAHGGNFSPDAKDVLNVDSRQAEYLHYSESAHLLDLLDLKVSSSVRAIVMNSFNRKQIETALEWKMVHHCYTHFLFPLKAREVFSDHKCRRVS